MVRLTPPMSSDVKIPEWALEAALEALKAARPAYDSEEQYDAHWEAIALALLAAEQRGLEKAAQVAVEIAAGRMRQSHEAKAAKKRDEFRDFESMSMSATDVAFAIRSLGEKI